ncbi:uncharacterized protein PITG_22088 [Phytophthora infestans T30-4]|uniref:Uncharacterized protein n=1 Tax=Phytophthora infestans (strain T30-4) TaxID=403677 RepID=D0RLV2_PHYIT|nr:uncharacterized protein PITG_22088 [Phytophthora infestans T30-4]EEY53664.1 conserved hypothetical protein [Phytophthora infestans T30-4]|eukprot:XP_002909979.1 conserved hypothetical protein [Phytophthora infestans T30-4]
MPQITAQNADFACQVRAQQNPLPQIYHLAEDAPLQEVGLFNDEDEEDTQRTKRARLRRGDETSDWHPFPLPEAPERHPTTSHRNHYNPDAPGIMRTRLELHACLTAKGNLRTAAILFSGRVVRCR